MLKSHFAVLIFVAAGLAPGPTPASASVTTSYSVLSNGEKVGHLDVNRDGRTVNIDFDVDNNGRGPGSKEHVELDARGIPTSWTIDGHSLMGGQVRERMQWKDGVQTWSSQADSGERKAPSPLLYVGNDASPWALGLYASLMLKSPQGSIAVLPQGELRIDRLGQVVIGSGKSATRADALLLAGVDRNPQLLLLDSKGEPFAIFGEEVLVRAGHEARYKELRTLADDLQLKYLQDIQRKAAHAYAAPVRIRNVRVFDPVAGGTSGPRTVVFYNGNITSVVDENESPTPVDEVEIDGGGGTITAGLHDMHTHSNAWSGLSYLAAGITTVRDLGNENPVLADLSRRIDAGELSGPHIIPSGFIEGRSPFSARLGVIPATLEDGLKTVNWYADHGYSQIKIYNSMNPEWVRPLSDEAKRLGMRTVGHVPAFTTPDKMLESGYGEITHINQLMLGWLLEPGEDTRSPLRLTAMARAANLDVSSPKVAHTVALMKQHGASLDSTVSIIEQLMLSRAGSVPENAEAYLDHMPIGYQRYRRRSYVNFKDAAEDEQYVKAFGKVLETIAMLKREGIPLWPGTDDTIGFSLHRELELYVKAGMSPAEVLRIATYDCDKYLRRDQLYGSIERGKRADFILTAGDPSQDIKALHAIRMVVKDGVVYFPAEMHAALGIRPFATAPTVRSPAANPARQAAERAFHEHDERAAFSEEDCD